MPQPLSKLALGANYEIGNVGHRPLHQRENLASLAMEAVAAWAHVEGIMLHMFVRLAGGEQADAAAVFLAMETATAKAAAITTLAERKLPADGVALLRAILKAHKSGQKERDKLAHWIWGTSNDLPDALLLKDPRNFDNNPDQVYVYREKDFNDMRARFERMAGCGAIFHMLLVTQNPEQAQQLYDQLCSEPEISENLGRQAQQG